MLEDGKFRAKPDTRLLDPACGSGTFLVLAIDAARRSGGCADMPPGRLLQAICRNIAGIDRNPLAVIAARVNYLIALGPLLKDRGREALEIPVYLGDSIRNDSLRDCEPSLKEQFDYVVGNPPWIGWENLPEDYRRATKKLWQEHGLFVHGGMDTILGKGKKDLSMLMTYVAADHYLKEGGKLGFVINQAVFKMAGAGQGFRRFLTRSKASLCCERVEDYSALQLFEGASAKAAVFVLKKGEKQRYPVPYFVARDTSGPGKSPTGSNRVILTGELCEAEPSDPSDPTSCWLTGNLSQLKALKKVMGRSDYEAHLGVNTGGANAVYWFEILKEEAFGCVVARNLVGAAKRKVKSQVVRLEKARLFPLLRGKDVSLWRAIPGAWLLLTQDPRTRRGIDESEMKKTPKTLEWLQQHQRMLQERAAYKRFFKTAEAPFWSMFDVGHYTLKPWKVVWPRIASQLEAAVVASMEGKPVLAQETFSCIGVECETEAFYVAGTINSTPFRLAVKAFSQPGSKSFGTPGILERARIPRFDPSSVLHYRISAEARKLCKGWQGPVGVAPLDALCRQLWGLTEQELKGLQTPPV